MDKEQLTQAIIDEMNVQGFLDEFIDKETGKVLMEIQFTDEKVACRIEPAGSESAHE